MLIAAVAWLLLQEPQLVSTSFFISPVSDEGLPKTTPTTQKLNPEKLVYDLESFLATQSGTWGVAITPLASNHRSLNINTFGINLDRPFPAASIMKVLVAANLINRVEKGEFSFEEKLEGGILKDLVRSMINRTDNEAWEILNKFLGLKKIQVFGENLGMENLNIYKNSFTPKDVNTLLWALYQKRVASANLVDLLLSWMQHTETEDRIPTAIQQELALQQAQDETPLVYHKAGTWPKTGTYSDAAIIEAKNPFILTILCENAPNRNLATQIIKTVTQKTFNFMGET